jgi:arylsulfatase A-like enzyme
VFTSWEPIGRHIVAPADVMQIAQSREHSLGAYLEADRQVAASARRHLHAGDPGALFVYFILPDATGHERGFDPRVRDYRRAIEAVDGLVGTLLRQIRAREFFRNEDWLVLVTTDHGGKGRHHRSGHQDKDVMSVFLIVSGRAARRGRIATTTYIVDPAVTALTFLGVTIDEAWGLDGRAVGLRDSN